MWDATTFWPCWSPAARRSKGSGSSPSACSARSRAEKPPPTATWIFSFASGETPAFSGYMKLRILLEDLLGARVDLVTETGLREAVRPFVEKDAIRVA